MKRRDLLHSGTIFISAALAGCSLNNNDPSDRRTLKENTPTPEPQHETQVTDFSPENTVFHPFAVSQDRKSRIRAEVRDEDGFSHVKLFLDNEFVDQPQKLLDDKLGGKKYTLRTVFPQNIIAPGKNTFQLEVTDGKNKTQEYTTSFNIDNNGYRIDFRNPDGQTIGNYKSRRKWDNHTFNQKQLNKLRQKWLKEAAYNGTGPTSKKPGLIKLLEQNKRKFPGYGLGTFYPNSDPDAEKINSWGYWDLNEFKKSTKFENILSWVHSPVRIRYQEIAGGAASVANDEFAATDELAIETLHPLFNGEQENYDLRAGFISTYGYGDEYGNHGMIHIYADTPNMDKIDGFPVDDIETEEEVRWWIVQPTNDAIVPAWKSNHRKGGRAAGQDTGQYNPIAYGYQNGDLIDKLTYNQEKRGGVGALLTMASGSNTQLNWNKFHINDEFLNQAYDHILDNGKIDPILEPLEHAIDKQIQDNEYIGIHGSLDDYRIDVTNEQIYNKVMKDSQPVSKKEIEDMLTRNTPNQNSQALNLDTSTQAIS